MKAGLELLPEGVYEAFTIGEASRRGAMVKALMRFPVP